MPTQLPRVPSLIPSSFATRAIGREVSITIFTASSLNSGEKLFFGRGNYFTFPDVHPIGWTVRKLRGTSVASGDPSGFVIVTHPFHPLNGQRLEVLYAKRRGADTVFVCSGGVSGQITLPQSWTDRGEPPLAWRLSAEGLAGLDTLARSLRGR